MTSRDISVTQFKCLLTYLNLLDEQKNIIDKAIKKRIYVAQTLYAIETLLCFINTYLSIFVIVVLQLNYAFALSEKPEKLNII